MVGSQIPDESSPGGWRQSRDWLLELPRLDETHLREQPLNRFCLAEQVSLVGRLGTLVSNQDEDPQLGLHGELLPGLGTMPQALGGLGSFFRLASCSLGLGKSLFPERAASAGGEGLKILPAVWWQWPWS